MNNSMTNQQLYLAIGIPSLLVLLTWLANFVQNSNSRTELRSEISTLRTEVRADISSLRTEMATELRAVRSDINMITKMYGEHGERLASLEAAGGGKPGVSK